MPQISLLYAVIPMWSLRALTPLGRSLWTPSMNTWVSGHLNRFLYALYTQLRYNTEMELPFIKTLSMLSYTSLLLYNLVYIFLHTQTCLWSATTWTSQYPRTWLSRRAGYGWRPSQRKICCMIWVLLASYPLIHRSELWLSFVYHMLLVWFYDCSLHVHVYGCV